MDQPSEDDDDMSRSASSSEADFLKGNEWDRREIPGEFGGEFLGEFRGEELPPEVLEMYSSPEISENLLLQVKDPKTLMLEQVKHVLYNLITDRPKNVIDYFEEYVRYSLMKDDDRFDKFISIFDHYFRVDTFVEEAYKWIKYKDEPGQDQEVGGEGAAIKKDYLILNRMDNFEDSGVRLTQLEAFAVAMAIQVLQEVMKNKDIRFWGKIYGLYKNYFVMEMGVTKEMIEADRNEEKEKKERMKQEEEEKKQLEEVEEEQKVVIKWNKVRKLADYIKPPMPKSTFVPPKFAPKERLGSGANKKVYYVSNEPLEGYIRLPDVMPIEIIRARQTKRFFTGVLEEEVITDPPFPGNESNLLRAQIARISAGTQISPLGYYTFDFGEGGGFGEEGGGEGDEGRPEPNFTPNPDFEPIPLQDMVDPTMAFWVHHGANILPQGRVIWVDPTFDPNAPKPEGEDFQKREKPEREVGPPLLTATSDDMSLETIPAWTTRLMMELAPSIGGAVAKSNLWLGALAYALATDNVFDNIYLGWGHKHNAYSFTPITYFIPQQEYVIGPEITEITDPDPEEEDYDEILYQQKKAEERRQKKLDAEGVEEQQQEPVAGAAV